MDKPCNDSLNHQRRHCLIFSDYICTSVVSEDTHGESISNMLSSWHILYSDISYLGLLNKDSISSSPAFLRRRYIVIKCTINLMESAALISCCECQTIEITVYNWLGNDELQEILCSLGCIQVFFCCSLELICFLVHQQHKIWGHENIFLVQYFWECIAANSTNYLDSNWCLTKETIWKLAASEYNLTLSSYTTVVNLLLKNPKASKQADLVFQTLFLLSMSVLPFTFCPLVMIKHLLLLFCFIFHIHFCMQEWSLIFSFYKDLNLYFPVV